MRFIASGAISAIRFNRTLLLTPPVVISRVSPHYYIHLYLALIIIRIFAH